jgi:hypothetical protein
LQSILNFVFTIVFCVINYLDMQTIHLNIHFSIQLINSFSAIYKNLKIINITYMIFIWNSVFTLVFYVTRWTKQDRICICFEEILNQLNLIYICICLYLQSFLNFVFTIVFCVTRLTKQDLSYIYFEESLNQLNLFYFVYFYIYNRSRVTVTRAHWPYYGLWPLLKGYTQICLLFHDSISYISLNIFLLLVSCNQ